MKLLKPLFLAVALCACATAPQTTRDSLRLTATDAATLLTAGPIVTRTRIATAAARGADPFVLLELAFEDGRVLVFEEANHTPHDLMAQAAGGPLAELMRLEPDATPALYRAREVSAAGALCAPQGVHAIGMHDGADGITRIVALNAPFEAGTDASGADVIYPAAPSIVCARLNFRRG